MNHANDVKNPKCPQCGRKGHLQGIILDGKSNKLPRYYKCHNGHEWPAKLGANQEIDFKARCPKCKSWISTPVGRTMEGYINYECDQCNIIFNINGILIDKGKIGSGYPAKPINEADE
jgi:hypothetical protein